MDIFFEDLKRVFKIPIKELYVDHMFYDWSMNSHIQGSYSSPITPEAQQSIELLAKNIDDKLYFCGEMYNKYEPTTLHGAI